MHCPYCNAALPRGANACHNCGAAKHISYAPAGAAQPGVPMTAAGYNVVAIVGFALSLLPIFPLVGLITSALGLAQCLRTGQRGRGLAVAGLILNFAKLALMVTAFLLMFFAPITALGREFPELFPQAARAIRV